MLNRVVFSVIVPVYNEEGNLHELYSRVSQAFSLVDKSFELIFVDDGSEDKSLDDIKSLASEDSRVKYLSFSRNFGHESALTAGLDVAGGDAVILMDGDLQDPPELIPELIKKWREGYDVVYARRQSRRGESIAVRATSYVFYRFMKRLTGIDIPPDTGDFRLMDKIVVANFKRCREQNRFVRGLLSWIGYRQTTVMFNRERRKSGKTKYNNIRRLLLAVDAIAGFSILPLRVSLLIGFMVVIFSLFVGIYIVIQKLLYGIPIPGYAFLVCSLYFLGGGILFVLGIIGEYIGKIYIEVQKRPLYVLQGKFGFDNTADGENDG